MGIDKTIFNFTLILIIFLVAAPAADSSELQFTIFEHSPNGTLVGHLLNFENATNTEAPSSARADRFHLLSVSPPAAAHLLSLDPVSGSLRTARASAEFDRESVCSSGDGEVSGPAQCTLKLNVYDALHERVLAAHVEIIDLNDSPPRYTSCGIICLSVEVHSM